MGDVTHIYTTDGTLVARYVYDAWGNHKIYDVNGGEVTKSMSAHIGNINPIRYRGYYYDDYENENGLYYLEARYYDPETGRFISQDEIDFIVPNHLTGLNLYAYCSNNPIMYTDPSGNFFLTALIVGAIAGAVIGATVGGVSAYNNAKASGATGGELIGKTVLGAVGGGVVGAVGGAIIGAGVGAAASAIAGGIGALSGSGMLAGSLATGGVVVSNGAIAATGALVAGVTFAIIGKSGGYTIEHHYPNDHDPKHVHISGDDIQKGTSKVDLSGKPLKGQPSLSPGAKKAFKKLYKEIIRALGPWL